MLARRLAESVGSNPREDERLRAEEEELRRCLDERDLVTGVPGDLPDFIGSEHEVWSDGHTVLKATLPGTPGISPAASSPSMAVRRVCGRAESAVTSPANSP